MYCRHPTALSEPERSTTRGAGLVGSSCFNITGHGMLCTKYLKLPIQSTTVLNRPPEDCSPGDATIFSAFPPYLLTIMAQPHKLAEVTRLMKCLEDAIKEGSLESDVQSAKQETILQQLRVYGRDPKNADPMYCEAGIRTLSRYAFESANLSNSREALRCIANALLLAPHLRQVFVELDCPRKAVQRLESQDTDDEFLLCRILFLLTYETKFDFGPLFDHNSLAECLNTHISRHADFLLKNGSDLTPIENSALSECLKLFFNLSNFYPQYNAKFVVSMESLFRILNTISITSPPLDPPVNYLVNALVNLNFEDSAKSISDVTIVFPTHSPSCNVEKLIELLDRAVSAYKPTQLETLAVPLITILRKMYDVAPEEVKRCMQGLLLPGEVDRDLPIGQSDSLSSRLLRLSTSAVAPNLREGISSIMFELSGEDASQFVRNVGYGFAAGYLMSRDIPIPETAKQIGGGTNGINDNRTMQINPITGQRLDKEPVGEEPEMTMEEKEREAERLFVLFDRLRATGVVDVQNPVRQAMEEGRFDNRIEEIEDPD